MVAGKTVCLRQLSRGNRALEVRFNRFLGHDKVTVDRIIESWSNSTGPAVEGRHVLAIQDTSEIHFNATPQRRRGLGEIGKGNNHGVLLHPRSRVRFAQNKVHTSIQGSGGDPTFPAQWLYGLCRALPGDEFVLSPSLPA